MCGHGDDGDILQSGVGLQAPCRVETGLRPQFDIHKDDIRMRAPREVQRRIPVIDRHHVKSGERHQILIQPHIEVVILDNHHGFRHLFLT